MYGLTAQDVLDRVSAGLKTPVTESELFASNIKLSYLKRVDKIFNKGIHYYLDPKTPSEAKEVSIFFRKKDFNADLNLEAKKIVNRFEDFSISLRAIAKLSDLEFTRTTPILTINHNPKKSALEIRKTFYPNFNSDLKTFLKALIASFAEKNILVFEFVETWNKKEKANIDGFFLKPNVIVLKRQQQSFRREIFTLAHELGHYLLEKEEVEELQLDSLANMNLSSVERWCNDFAFYFLAGEYAPMMDALDTANASNDYHFDLLERVSKQTHLSIPALFTRLRLNETISPMSYSNVIQELNDEYAERQAEKEKQKLLDKQNGINTRGSSPQPIKSPLLVSTIQAAFYEGVLSEYDVCKQLNIKPDKFDKFIE